jgi:hypothetical protein
MVSPTINALAPLLSLEQPLLLCVFFSQMFFSLFLVFVYVIVVWVTLFADRLIDMQERNPDAKLAYVILWIIMRVFYYVSKIHFES